MSTHAVTLRLEENGIAVEGKTGRTAHVAAVGQVDDGAVALCADKTYIGIRVVPVTDEFEGEPFSVRRPGIVESAVCAVPGGAIGNLAHFLRIKVHHHEAGTVFYECQLFTVGRELRESTLNGG